MKVDVKDKMTAAEYLEYVKRNQANSTGDKKKHDGGKKAKAKIASALLACGEKWRSEYFFAKPERLYRFDYAIEHLKIGIEYEGIMSDQSRHTNIVGYTGDADKYNLAANMGWVVLRFTAINVGSAYQTIMAAIKSRRDAQNIG